ncbi:MAG TPA: portal protein [Acidocella sp.]|nr:portal protein [Acidocella sp.]
MAPLDNTAPYEQMGATLLSQQPPAPPSSAEIDQKNWQTVYSHLEARLSSLRNWRYSWWTHWARLAEYFLPRRYQWVVTPNKMWKGNPINDAIVDGTATWAVGICASGLWTGLTSPSRPWFKLASGISWEDLDAAGQQWLENTEKKVYTVLAQSNFYDTMAQAFQDVTVFGTAPVIMYEDFYDVIRCYLPCAGEYFLAVGSRLSVDTLYREFTQTVSQIVEMYQLENCPPEVQKQWREGGGALETELVVCHAIEPNFKLATRESVSGTVAVVPEIFTYREIYWLKGNKTAKPLSKKGFRDRPFFAARWATTSNDPYGRSPCMDALGDNKQVQLETRRKAEFIEKGVRPPMGADPELKNEPSSILPGNVTFFNTANGKKGFFPLFEPAPQWLTGLVQDIENVNERIKNFLYVNVFMAITQMEGVQPRNELELTKRDLERLQILGPFISKFEGEFASPAIQRVINILQRRNLLDPMPPSLAKKPIKIAFTSIMRLAQQSAESVAMKDVMQTAGGLASAAQAAGLPNPLRLIDLDKALRTYGDINGFPEELFFTADQVAQHDQERAKAQAAAQAPAQAMAAVDAAHTLASTPVGGPTALSALTGGGGAGGGI